MILKIRKEKADSDRRKSDSPRTSRIGFWAEALGIQTRRPTALFAGAPYWFPLPPSRLPFIPL